MDTFVEDITIEEAIEITTEFDSMLEQVANEQDMDLDKQICDPHKREYGKFTATDGNYTVTGVVNYKESFGNLDQLLVTEDGDTWYELAMGDSLNIRIRSDREEICELVGKDDYSFL